MKFRKNRKGILAPNTNDVAIIGLGLKFPKSETLDEFWQHLSAGESLITEVTPERWDKDKYYGNPNKEPNKTNSIWGGFVDGIDTFDAEFFNISPREAETMDPQQRMALELSWKAIEDAGIRPGLLAGSKTGVFMGVCHWDYAELIEKYVEEVDAYFPTGVAYSILANRISYFFDLKGPSVTNDTACASSLVSIHEAMKAITSNECDFALAGGVNMIWSPKHFVAFGKNGMLSKDGKCNAFDQSANGYVRGEGGAVLLLKSLNKAVEDNDPIYAVIKGTGTNHGGKTNSLTVTNPKAQASLIKDIYRKAGIKPETIGYIEAHGPGTPIGDPIEVHGLKMAFEDLYKDTGSSALSNSCGLGSVKTNIGHLEGAAGVAGVIKVIAAMQHGELPATVNFKQLNPLIKLKGSPFYVVDRTQKWQAPLIHGKLGVRRAGVSSFGFGGSNAHILLEEYPEKITKRSPKKSKAKKSQEFVVPFSAKNKKQLKASLIEFIRFLEDQNTKNTWIGEDEFMQNFAYTLQLGREEMDERFVVVTTGIRDLLITIKLWVKGESSIANCWQGNVNDSKGKKEDQAESQTLNSEANACLEKGMLDQVANFWLRGVSLNWSDLYTDHSVKKIRLPSYAFAKDKHWFKFTKVQEQSTSVEHLHALIHRNTSTLAEQSYSTRFSGDEFFLADHIINKEKILPAVVYLEMIRSAASLSFNQAKDSLNIRLRNIVWIQALVVKKEGVEVTVALIPQAKGEISFEIRSLSSTHQTTIHCKGFLLEEKSDSSVQMEQITTKYQQKSLLPKECYKAFRGMAMEHGLRMRGLQELNFGENSLLAKIHLPNTVKTTEKSFVLHPSIMDSAMHATVVFLQGYENILKINQEEHAQPALPFSLESLEILNACKAEMYVQVNYAQGSERGDGFIKLDVKMFDTEGMLCVSLSGYSARTLKLKSEDADEAEVQTQGAENREEASQEHPLMYTSRKWNPAKLQDRDFAKSIDGNYTLIHLGLKPQLIEHVAANFRNDIKVINLTKTSLVDPEESFYTVFLHLQEIIKSKAAGQQKILAFFEEREQNFEYASITALIKTAMLEKPALLGRAVLIDPDIAQNEQELRSLIENEITTEDRATEIRYTHSGIREKRTPSTININRDQRKMPAIVENGIYWITGGSGGLGKIFADYVAQTKNVKILLNGRSEINTQIEEQVIGLRKQGAEVFYIQANVSDETDVERLVSGLIKDHKGLNGIFHCAGTLRDSFILNKTKKEITEVFAPKLNGTRFIDKYTQDIELDFFVLFSSIAVLGNVGQADYAGVNAILDEFSHYRNHLVKAGKRKGRTLSVNWPLWQSGGMNLDEASLNTMYKQKGLVPLPTKNGVQALVDLLEYTRNSDAGVVYGDSEKIKAYLQDADGNQSRDKKSQKVADTRDNSIDTKELKTKTSELLKNILAEAIHMDPAKIRVDQKLSEYGLDSIVIVDITAKLEDLFGSLSKTLFFEYVDLQGIVGYFMESHENQLIELLDLSTKKQIPENEAKSEADNDGQVKSSGDTNTKTRFYKRGEGFSIKEHQAESEQKKSTHDTERDIAIIGVAGKYPEAETLDEFWELLSEGRHCFKKVPKDRWDHDKIYFNERDVLGKSTIKTGSFIDDIDKFDPRYFSISKGQAELMSPEVRLFMEIGVKAFEDAGYSKEYMQTKYDGDVGVLVGTMSNHYGLYGFQNMLTRGSVANGSYTGAIPNMLSYFYGFTGPSIFLDTMCSGSSTCIHQAVQMLRAGECKMVIAGGISLLLHPYHLISSSQEHYTSKTAEIIKSYGQGADGTILGEGLGAVVLKPLAEAKKDGDQIYGVIRGTALSNAGIRNGFTVPNPHMQALAIEKAIADSKIDSRTISYIEGHGSGTSLGDPIEIKGLDIAFKKHTSDLQYCAIGSVKSNIAHLLGGAGVAGITKVLLQFKHKQIAPSLHSDKLNPSIDFEKTAFYVNQDLREWKQPELQIDGQTKKFPRRAGITSIGAGGMNSHIILEEHIQEERNTTLENQSPASKLFVFSAMNSEVLSNYLVSFKSYIQSSSEHELASISYTLQIGKNELPCRLAFIANSKEELLSVLDRFLNNALESVNDIHFVSSLFERSSDVDALDIDELISDRNSTEIARYWANGIPVNWEGLYPEGLPHRVSLPAYPFEKIRCWYTVYDDAPSVEKPLSQSSKLHPFIGINESGLEGMKFSTKINKDELLDYVYTVNKQDRILSSFLIDTSIALGGIIGMNEPILLSELSLVEPLTWSAVTGLNLEIEKRSVDGYNVSYRAVGESMSEVLYATATLKEGAKERDDLQQGSKIAVDAFKAKAVLSGKGDAWYADLMEGECDYSLYLQSVKEYYLDDKRGMLLNVDHPILTQEFNKKRSTFSSGVLAAIIQGGQYLSRRKGLRNWAEIVPSSISTVIYRGELSSVSYLHFQGINHTEEEAWTISLCDAEFNVLGVLKGVDYQVFDSKKLLKEVKVDSIPVESKITEVSADKKQKDKLVYRLRKHAAAILKSEIEEVDEHTHFYAFGFESIALSKFANRINDELGTAVTPAQFFQCENIKELSEHILNQYPENFEANDFSGLGSEDLSVNGEDIAEKLQLENVLKARVAGIAKFRIEEIDSLSHFQAFGFDSITLSRLSVEINEALDTSLTPDLFFQCENIEELAEYLRKNYKLKLDHTNTDASKWAAAKSIPKAVTESQVGSQEVGSNKTGVSASEIHIKSKKDTKNHVAIIGADAKFPEADSLKEFWSNLETGRDSIQDFPLDRYDPIYQKIIKDSEFPKKAAFIRDVDTFDASFFQISPFEAELMDPQHRLALQTIWKALEHSGYNPKNLPQSTGVFFGVSGNDYMHLINAYGVPVDAFTATGNAHSMLVNRVSFLLDIHGPSEPIDTACSSSLVAVHRAVENIINGTCEMAIAGGVNLLLSCENFIGPYKAGMLSPDGHCKTFSKHANGYVRGEGVGAVVLKSLAQAEKDKDTILGVIIGSAVNHGGKASSLTAPNAKSQAMLIEQAMRGVDPQTIDYVETHGTGTRLGDPVEVSALTLAYSNLMTQSPGNSMKHNYCGLGSVKTNIGHLEAAAGIAGLMKVLGAFETNCIPASLHSQEVNPYIELKNTPFYITKQREEWPAKYDSKGNSVPRRVGISSFGFGGVNAHLVLENYTKPTPQTQEPISSNGYFSESHVIGVSAATKERLQVQVEELHRHLSQSKSGELSLAGVAYTLQTGREALSERLACVVKSLDELKGVLKGYLQGHDFNGHCYTGTVAKMHSQHSNSKTSEDDPMIKKMIESKEYTQIAQVWVNGARVNWELYHYKKPLKHTLPSYPFQATRHWISAQTESEVDEDLSSNGSARFDEYFYTELLDMLSDKSMSVEQAMLKAKNYN